MASAYQIAREYTRFIPPVDLNLFAQAMQTKQAKYEQNYNDLAQRVDMLKNIDIIKAEDKDYFTERANKIIDTINNYGSNAGLDLSNRGVGVQLGNYMNQALDNNVINAVKSTQKYRSFVSEMGVLKEKHPEKYNPINEAYALRPFVSYLNDGKVGSELGNLTYDPYINVFEKQSKAIKDYLTSRGVSKEDINTNDPYSLVTLTKYGIAPDDIANYLENALDPTERKQLQINGWYNLGGANNEQREILKSSYINAKMGTIDNDINLIDQEIKSGRLNASQLEQYRQKKAFLSNQKIKLDDLSRSKDTEFLNYTMEKDRLLSSLVSLYGDTIVGKEYKENKSYIARVGHGLEQQRINVSWANHNLESQKFQHNVNQDNIKNNLENQKLLIEMKKAGLKVDANGEFENEFQKLPGKNKNLGSKLLKDATDNITKQSDDLDNAALLALPSIIDRGKFKNDAKAAGMTIAEYAEAKYPQYFNANPEVLAKRDAYKEKVRQFTEPVDNLLNDYSPEFLKLGLTSKKQQAEHLAATILFGNNYSDETNTQLELLIHRLGFNPNTIKAEVMQHGTVNPDYVGRGEKFTNVKKVNGTEVKLNINVLRNEYKLRLTELENGTGAIATDSPINFKKNNSTLQGQISGIIEKTPAYSNYSTSVNSSAGQILVALGNSMKTEGSVFTTDKEGKDGAVGDIIIVKKPDGDGYYLEQTLKSNKVARSQTIAADALTKAGITGLNFNKAEASVQIRNGVSYGFHDNNNVGYLGETINKKYINEFRKINPSVGELLKKENAEAYLNKTGKQYLLPMLTNPVGVEVNGNEVSLYLNNDRTVAPIKYTTNMEGMSPNLIYDIPSLYILDYIVNH